MPKDEKERATGHDSRVDHAGFCGELDSEFNKPLREKIKESMLGRKLDVAEANFFEGLLITGWASDVDPEKFVKAYDEGKIKREDFIAALEIKKGVCKDFIAPRQLIELCKKPARYQSLRITRKKNVEIQLIDAVNAIAAAVQGRTAGRPIQAT